MFLNRDDFLKRDDKGLTLIEVVVTVALLTIIIVPLTSAMITYLRNTEATNDRLAASHDAQIAAAYFSQDVQSIGLRDWTTAPYNGFHTSVEVNVRPTSGANPCGPASGPLVEKEALLRLAWDDPSVATGTPPKVVVSYVAVPVGGGFELHRWRCDISVEHTIVSFKDTVVAHNLEAVPAPECDPLDCDDPALPQSISMELSILVPGSANSTLIVTLRGQRRQS